MISSNRTNLVIVLTAALAAAIATGCATDPEPGSGDPGEIAGATFAVSDCGGFAEAPTPTYSDHEYCDAELLRWSYDPASRQLELFDSRAVLNCCGDREVTVEQTDSGLIVTETDAPEAGAGRCDCLCVFDFSITVDGVAPGALPVQIERVVTDGGTERLFDGTLDLTEGAGEAVLDEQSAEPWCDPTASTDPEASYDVSTCGGFDLPTPAEEGDYCEAERLLWTHDAASGSLELIDQRASLNCCGERSFEVEQVDGVYVVTQLDAPDPDSGRCYCTCAFDLAVTIEAVTGGEIALELRRDRTDDDQGLETLFQGVLDLGPGSGSVVLDDTDLGPGCTEG